MTHVTGQSSDPSPDRGYLGDKRWTVVVTLRVWRDKPDEMPIAEAVDAQLHQILGPDEPMTIEVIP